MSKRKTVLLLIALAVLTVCSLVLPKATKADPADITYIDVFLPAKDKDVRNIKTEIHIPWNEALLFLSSDQKNASPSSSLFIQYQAEYSNYLIDHISLTNNEDKCNLRITGMPPVNQDELMFGRGAQINGEFDCTGKLDHLILRDDVFTERFPLQTNIVNAFEETSDKIIQGALLTGKNPEMIMGFGKDYVAKADVKATQVSAPTDNNKFVKVLAAHIGETSLIPTMLIVFALGFLHTAEAGHSKTILAAALIDKKVSLKQAVGFSAVFTATHIADILLMGIILLIANSFVDVFSKLPYLQVFALYSLFFISFYLFMKNTVHFLQHRFNKHHHGHDHEHEHHHDHISEKSDFKHQLLMGMIAGIAPCLFGWSIFMVILSTRSVISIFPIIGAFGLGIFFALLVFALIVTKIKAKFFQKQTLLGEISPIVSALILLVYSLTQIL